MKDTWNSAEINEALNDGSYGNGGAGLPTPEEGDTGKILTLDSDLEPSWESPAKDYSLDYTTTPTATGIKFNGKDVYRAIFPYAATSDTITVGSTMEFTVPNDIETPINAFYVFDGSGGNYGTIIQANQVRVNGTTAKVYVDSASFSGVPGNTFYLVMDYTKVTT